MVPGSNISGRSNQAFLLASKRINYFDCNHPISKNKGAVKAKKCHYVAYYLLKN
jgi:hypothetical protein